MEKELNKEIATELMKIKGEARGASLMADGEFIVKEKGEESLGRLEKRMAELGCPLKYKEIRPMEFFPVGLRAVTLLAVKELFDFKTEDFRRMGAFGTKFSLIVKLFMKYFASLKILAKQAPKMWRKYYTEGELRASEINEKEKFLVLRLENFKLHPLHCRLLEGYFANIIRMVVGEEVKCRERKCPFQGQEYHEFYSEW